MNLPIAQGQSFLEKDEKLLQPTVSSREVAKTSDCVLFSSFRLCLYQQGAHCLPSRNGFLEWGSGCWGLKTHAVLISRCFASVWVCGLGPWWCTLGLPSSLSVFAYNGMSTRCTSCAFVVCWLAQLCTSMVLVNILGYVNDYSPGNNMVHKVRTSNGNVKSYGPKLWHQSTNSVGWRIWQSSFMKAKANGMVSLRIKPCHSAFGPCQ